MTEPRRVLLVVPPSTQQERYGDFADAGAVYPSLGLACVAAVAREAGHQVRVVDAEAERLDYPDIDKVIQEWRPHLVGLQTFCSTIRRCFEVARRAKAVDPSIMLVLGGVQVTLQPEEGLSEPAVDLLVYGEGERPFLQLLEVLGQDQPDWDSIPGLHFRRDGRVVTTPRPELICELDGLPYPALDLFRLEHYHSASQLRGRRTLHIMTSRGCPYQCSYCSGDLIFGSTFRHYPTERVLDELEHMRRAYGIDSVQFYDETFSIRRDRVLELCHGMIRRDLVMPWTCFTRVDLVDEELLQAMSQAGCYQIFFGVETGVERLLTLINKGTTLDQAREAFRLTRKLGIETVASFMLTLPTETEEETWESIRFGLELDPDYVYWLTFTPYPGTPLSQRAEETGTILDRDYESYNVFNRIVYLPEGRELEEVKRTLARAYRRFYLRPRYLLRRLRSLVKLPPGKVLNLAVGGLRTFTRRRV